MKFIDSFLQSHTVKDYQINGQTWYKLVDIGEALGYVKSRKALYKLMHSHQKEFDTVTTVAKIPVKSINTATGKEYTAPRETLLMNKEGIIKILMYSNLPVAREFRKSLIEELAG